MDELRIRLFGGLKLCRAGQESKVFPTRESENLFCFLVLNRGRVFQREVLLEYFYPDVPEVTGKKRLRTALWRIKSVLTSDSEDSSEYIYPCGREVGFNSTSEHWLDIQNFEDQLASIPAHSETVLTNKEIEGLIGAVELYRGDLLEGCYEEWCLWQKERFKLMLIRALEEIMSNFAAKQDWQTAIIYAQQLLSHDTLREHVHRDVMRFHYRAGDRPAALKQYRICERQLKSELGIKPMQETTKLYELIRLEKGFTKTWLEARKNHQQINQGPVPAAFTNQVYHLEKVFQQIDKARSTLSKEIERLRTNENI